MALSYDAMEAYAKEQVIKELDDFIAWAKALPEHSIIHNLLVERREELKQK